MESGERRQSAADACAAQRESQQSMQQSLSSKFRVVRPAAVSLCTLLSGPGGRGAAARAGRRGPNLWLCAEPPTHSVE